MSLIIRGARVVDLRAGAFSEPRTVTVEGETIARIGREPDREGSGSEKVVDLEGAYLVPGLIDLHTHLIWSGGPDPAREVDQEGFPLSLLRAGHNARTALRQGVTTVRDLGSNDDAAIHLARAQERGYLEGPRVIASGRSIIMTGGHDPFWGRPADGPDEGIKAVREQVHQGARVIKVSATGGVYGKIEAEEVGTAELSQEEMTAICNEARKFGLRVAAHAIGREGILNCLASGVKTIEHGHFLTQSDLEEMKTKDMFWVPTLEIYRRIALGEGLPEYAVRKSRGIVAAHKAAFNRALELGVSIGAGSDAGSPGLPHPALIDELECMVDYEAETVLALRSATITAARALGLEERLGEIKEGKAADLLAVSADPLKDVSSLRQVVLVCQAGRVVRQETG